MKPQDIADLKQLIEFLKEYQVAEFDLDRGDLKIRLKFNQPPAPRRVLGDLARLLARRRRAAAQAPRPAQCRCTRQLRGAAGGPTQACTLVKSPIVGTYYGSPSPGAAPLSPPAITWRRAR